MAQDTGRETSKAAIFAIFAWARSKEMDYRNRLINVRRVGRGDARKRMAAREENTA